MNLYEAMTDEQIAKRISSDKGELERRVNERIATAQKQHQDMMALALSNGVAKQKRGRKPANAAD